MCAVATIDHIFWPKVWSSPDGVLSTAGTNSVYKPPCDKINKVSVRPAKTRTSLGIMKKLGPLATHWVHSEDSDQTVGFVTRRLNYDDDQSSTWWMTMGFIMCFFTKLMFEVPVKDSISCPSQMSRCTTKPIKMTRTQSLRCLHEEILGPWLPTERTAKTLIRPSRCPCWSKSSLGAQVILLVLSCCCSIFF